MMAQSTTLNCSPTDGGGLQGRNESYGAAPQPFTTIRESESHHLMKPPIENISEMNALSKETPVRSTAVRTISKTGSKILTIALFFSVGLAGCAASSSQFFQEHSGTQNAPSTSYSSDANSAGNSNGQVIRPGDELDITVWGYPEFNTTATVNEHGAVTVPLLGEVAAAGMTTENFKAALKQHLAAYVKGNARVTVSHIQMNQKINVMGSVTKQASYPVFGEISLIQAIAEAGGPAPDADLRHIKIFRTGAGHQYEEVNLTKHLENGNIQDVPEVKAGDTVYVPQQDDLLKDLSGFGYEVLLLFGFFKLVG